MSEDDIKALLERIPEIDDKINATPESALAMLVEEGIYTEDGQLSENYR